MAIITLIIHDLRVEDEVARPGVCDYDYVEIRAGRTKVSPLLAKYCGDVNVTTVSRHGNLTLRFVSDETKEKAGFNASFFSASKPCCVIETLKTLRNKDESNHDGSCEKCYFLFSFSVLDHLLIFPFDFCTRFSNTKR